MSLRYLSGVATLKLDAAKCTGCGLCPQVCPHGVLEMAGGKARITDADLCMECGACAGNCPASALSLKKGVGCAAAVITGFIKGTEPVCGCGEGGDCC